jgi:hypothetical protein
LCYCYHGQMLIVFQWAYAKAPNGLRYAPAYVAGVLVGGTRGRCFDGTSLKP